MAGPGGDEVGRVSIRVVPDSDGFRDRLRAAVEGAEQGVEATVPVHFDVDPEELKTKLEAIQARLTIPVDLGDGTEIERLRTRLQALDDSQVTIPVELGDGTEIERLRARLATLDAEDISISVRLAGVELAIARLEVLERVVGRLDGRQIDLRVDVDGLAAAVTQLTALGAISNDTGEAITRAGSSGTREFGRLDSSMRNVVQGLGMAIVLAPALAVAGAGITAAWGAASTAIAVIPGLITGAVAAIGTVAVGLDGIKKAAKTIKPEFDKLKKSVSDTFERGFVQVFKTLATTFPTLTTGMNQVAVSITGIAQRLADMVASRRGLELIRANFANMAGLIDGIQPGLTNIVSTFLELGAQSSVFDVLRGAINEFGASFRSNIVDLIQSGTLDTAMRGLRDMLVELGQGFSDLVHNGIELFAAAAPGVNQFLDSLSGFFNRFNWDSLGKSVGKVFSGLGETLDSVDTQTIRDIEAAFGRLGDLFKDKEFQDNLKEMIEGIPAAIDQIKELSRAFGEIGAAISGLLKAINAVDKPFSDFIKGIGDNIDKLRRQMAGENGLNPEDPFGLKLLDDDPAAFFTVWEVGFKVGFARLGTLINIGMAGVGQAFSTGWILASGGVDLSFGQIEAVVTLGMGQIQAAVTLGMGAVQTAMTLGWTTIQTATQVAWALIPTYVSLGWTGIQLAIDTGMLLAQTAMSVGWTTIQTATSLAWTLIPTYVSLGWASIQLAIDTGMLLAQTAMSVGWTTIQTATSVAWALIPTYVSLGWTTIQTAIDTGMALAQISMQTGWDTIKVATSLAWDQIKASVSLAWGLITADTQTGATTTQNTTTSAWDQIKALTSTAWETIKTTIANAVTGFVTAVQTGVAIVVGEMTALPGRITGAIGNLGSLLVGAGRALMDGLLAGIKAGFETVLSFARGIAAKIAAVKGPRQLDLRILRPAGQWLMQGLGDGLRTGMDRIRSLVSSFTGEFAALQFAPPQLVNAREFANTGQLMGEQLEAGLLAQRSALIATAREITDRIGGEFTRLDTTGVATGFDNVSTRLHDELGRSAAELDAATAGAPGAAPVEIVQNFNVPSAEKASDKAAQGMRRLHAVGLFG